jgi:hypothetical protein
MNKFAVLLLAIALSVVALAQNPVGKWKGSLKIDRAGIPKAQSPEQDKAVKQMLAQVESARFSLDMKGNKTFTVDVPSMMGQPAQRSEGTWSQKGNVITMVTTKQNGKAPKNSQPQSMKIDSNGKKMVLVAGNGPQKATITFVK